MNEQDYSRTIDIKQVVPINQSVLEKTIEYMINDFRTGANRYEKDIKKNIYIQSFCDSLLYKILLLRRINNER